MGIVEEGKKAKWDSGKRGKSKGIVEEGKKGCRNSGRRQKID